MGFLSDAGLTRCQSCEKPLLHSLYATDGTRADEAMFYIYELTPGHHCEKGAFTLSYHGVRVNVEANPERDPEDDDPGKPAREALEQALDALQPTEYGDPPPWYVTPDDDPRLVAKAIVCDVAFSAPWTPHQWGDLSELAPRDLGYRFYYQLVHPGERFYEQVVEPGRDPRREVRELDDEGQRQVAYFVDQSVVEPPPVSVDPSVERSVQWALDQDHYSARTTDAST